MSIKENINQIRALHAKKNILARQEREALRPMKTDCAEIASICQRFKEVANPKYKDNSRIFVFIVIYMYSPSSIISGAIRRNGVRNEIAKVLGVRKPAVTRYFGDAKSLFLNHIGFRNEAERIFQLISER
ncbi:MAG: hypothetical protein IKO85_05115 [Bacteroidaceae bacterium]|nr:hypothetical protein [Bacteroidaceae bacterium]